MAFDYNKASGAGVDQIDDSVLGMPLLNIIQTGSPQVKKSHKDYATKAIPGAEPGQIVFAPTNTVIPAPVKAIVLATTTLYTQWRPKAKGGGFVGNSPLSIINERGYRKGPAGTKDEYKEYLNDNELKYTMFFAIQFLDGAKWKKGFIPFTSTGLKIGREWTKAIKRIKSAANPDVEMPIFSGLWNLTTGPQQNAEGDWMGWTVTLDRVLDATTDEALLVSAYANHTEVQKAMPSPKAAAAITDGETTVAGADVPY